MVAVKKKPLVVVTPKLPDSTETRLRELFDTRLNLDDTPMTQAQLADAFRTADIIVPTVTDEITGGVAEGSGVTWTLEIVMPAGFVPVISM